MILKNPGTILFSILLISLVANQGCARIAATSISLPMTPTAIKTGTPTPINISRPTKTLTTDFSLTADFMETESVKNIVVTDQPTVTATTTPIPPGTFALLFYPPLIMNYDTSVWKMVKVDFLQVLSLEICQLGEIGPSDNFPTPDEILQLGNIRYQVTVSENTPPGLITVRYIEDQSLNGFDYSSGVAVLLLQAKPSEWNECKTLGERVLSTLHVP